MLKTGLFRKNPNRLEGLAPTPRQVDPHIPEELCLRCPGCGKTLFSSELEESSSVCPHCGYHFRLSARQRLALLLDEGSFEEWEKGMSACDPLDFPGYQGKLKSARLQSRESDGVVTGRGTIGGLPCAIFVMDPYFMMGSMGSVVGEKITRLFERATARNLPVIGCTVSGGARMQEGILSLMQMAKTSGAIGRHSQAGGLYIVLLTDPTTGGVTASFAMEGDITLAEPGALIGFAGPRVIEQTIRQKLPQGFQRAEFLMEKGFVDQVVPRREQRPLLERLLRLHQKEGN